MIKKEQLRKYVSTGSLITLFLIAWYLTLSIAHYLNQRLMWNDEMCVFNSIEQLKPHEMFTMQLKNLQVFPRAYLFCIQQFSRLFDFHILSLRFLPFVCMLTAFWFWLKLARTAFKDNSAYWTYLLSWAASVVMVYYAAELKPYSMDVLVGALFMTFLYREEDLRRRSPRKYKMVLAALPALGLFSYPAFLFAMIVFYNLGIVSLKDKSQRPYWLIYTISLVMVFLISYAVDMRLRPIAIVTEGFGDYFISSASIGEFFRTFGDGVNSVFCRSFVRYPRIMRDLSMPFLVLGIINMFYSFFANIKKDGWQIRSLKTVPLALFTGLVILGILKKYPLVTRTTLFFFPFVLVLVVDAITGLKNRQKHIFTVIHVLYILFLLAMTVGIAGQVFSGDLGALPTIWKF